MVLNGLVAALIAAMFVEAIWESIKMIFQSGKFSPDRLGALIIGVLIAVAGGIDLPKMIGVPLQIPYLGMVLTGILFSRGSNFVHDLLIKLQKPDLLPEGQPLSAPTVTEEEIVETPTVDNSAVIPGETVSPTGPPIAQ